MIPLLLRTLQILVLNVSFKKDELFWREDGAGGRSFAQLSFALEVIFRRLNSTCQGATQFRSDASQ